MIVLVETQRSMMDVCEIGTSNTSKLAGPMPSEPRPATLGYPSFALGPVAAVYSTTDNEAESHSRHSRVAKPRWAGTWLGRGHSRSEGAPGWY